MEQRIDKCVKKIKAKGLDSILISDPINITYLTGFRQAEGYLLLTSADETFYFTNFLYQEEAKKNKKWRAVVSNGKNIFKLISDKINSLNLKNTGFEAKNLPFLEYKVIQDNISKKQVNFVKTIDLIENLRAVKTGEEIELIKKSISITEETLEFTQEIFTRDMTEKDLSIEVEKFLKLKGDNHVAFSPIVAAGKNSACPHHIPKETELNKNFFLIDLGAKYHGYCADLTRTFFWYRMPPLFKGIYETLKKAHDSSIAKVKDGVKISLIDAAARDIISQKGWGKYFGHGLGHGVGLCVHEPPFISSKNDDVLKEGMVITIEPAVYIKGKFGIRIENMVLVKKDHGEILSNKIIPV